MIRKTAVSLFLLISGLPALAGTVVLTSTGDKVIKVDPPASTGLKAVYVAGEMNGVTAVYSGSANPGQVKWYRFSSLGGGYAEEISGAGVNGNDAVLSKVDGDMGYIVEDGTERTYFWVVDYSKHYLHLESLTLGRSEDCSFTLLDLAGDASPIVYYTINGRAMNLSRDLKLTYNTLEWDEAAAVYAQRSLTETLDDTDGTIRVTSPLCSTDFHLTGDRFLTAWGRPEQVTSPVYAPVAVEAHTSALQEGEKPDNQIGAADGLGGSAPAVIEFKASVTDAAIYTEWQFSTYSDFEDIELRVNDTEFTHTFTEMGTTYVRFVCDNADGGCQFVGEVYQINIGESSLMCPNAFSPGASEGVNDEWRVSYKSIVSFECHIFDRYGHKITSFTDPSQGWDGKKGGKLVPAGVYYYVIKARGSDGRKYNLSGDINIIDYK